MEAGTATLAAGMLASSSSGKDKDKDQDEGGKLSKGDGAILRFLAAAEILESDLWVQYNELGGVQDSEDPGVTRGRALYIATLEVLDGDIIFFKFNVTAQPKKIVK